MAVVFLAISQTLYTLSTVSEVAITDVNTSIINKVITELLLELLPSVIFSKSSSKSLPNLLSKSFFMDELQFAPLPRKDQSY